MNNENVNGDTTVVVENKKKKSHKAWLVIVLILIMLLIFGLGVYLGCELCSKKKTNTNSSNNDEPKIVELNQNGIKNIMDRFKAIKIPSDKLFKNNKYEISSISLEEMLVTSLSKHDIYNVCAQSGIDIMLLDEINEDLNRFLGRTITMNDIKNVNDIGIGSPYDYSYSLKVEDNKRIRVKDYVCGGEFGAEDYVYGKIIKGETKGDYAYIYEKEAFAKYDMDSVMKGGHKVNYYKDYNKTGAIIENIESSEYTDGNGNPIAGSTPNWDLYNTYKYTFKLIDGAYYFQSFELVK